MPRVQLAVPAAAIGLIFAASWALPANAATAGGTPGDWPQFGYDSRHSGTNPQEATIQQSNVASLHVRYRATLGGVVDNAPVFLSSVATSHGLLDLLFMTTKDGRLLAVDAATGATIWSHQPAAGPGYTTSTPAIDPNRQWVYSYGLDGRVHKYRVGDGQELTGGGWPQLATLKPEVEKCSPGLDVATAANGHSYLYVSNGGYPGDRGDYQGHITAIDLGSGVQRVWNANCSDQPVHFTLGNPDCPSVQTAVWARAGVVYDSDLDRILIATGNGPFDVPQGGHDWGDSVLELRPNGNGNGGAGQPLDSYTPASFQQLQNDDADLGSTAPAILPGVPGSALPHLAVQGGKDASLRLLNLDDLSGRGRPGQVAGELQVIGVPQGGEVLTAPAVWTDPVTGTPWVFVANGSGISGLQVVAGNHGMPSLLPVWTHPSGGTSPVAVNGLVFYAGSAGLLALSPRHGAVLWSDGSAAALHWQSPIVVDGRVYLADGLGNLWAYEPSAPSSCVADGTTLCLQSGRFRVRASWQSASGASGDGQAAPLTADTGYFWFFASSNVEVLVKVLNGCGAGNHYWVFAGGLTDVHVTLTVTDTANGSVKVYQNPQGTAFVPIQDTGAFATCP